MVNNEKRKNEALTFAGCQETLVVQAITVKNKATQLEIMLVSITKIELISYSKLIAFFKFNGQIINELKQSKCKKYKISGDWNLKVWYTMTLWESEKDVSDFYRNGIHLEAMKQSKTFSSRIKSNRIYKEDLITWKEAKRLFAKN